MMRRSILALLTGGVFVLPWGCNAPEGGPAAGRQRQSPAPPPELSHNVQRVVCIYPMAPWLSFDRESDLNPEGFKFTLYLLDSDLKGVIGDGTITVDIYEISRNADGTRRRTKVFERNLDPERAALFRVRTPTALGRRYGMMINWGDADLLGKKIEVVTSFQRRDGRRIRAQTKELRVPAAKMP